MPALSIDRGRLRRTDWLTLLAWMVALSTGVVSACLLVISSAERIDVAMRDRPWSSSLQAADPLLAEWGGVAPARRQT